MNNFKIKQNDVIAEFVVNDAIIAENEILMEV